jgi:alkylation response protein AidB-like acyl-CoA dehydrogenase
MRRTLFGEDHEAFGESFRKFAAAEIIPHLGAWEEAGIVPRELFAAAGRAGFLARRWFGRSVGPDLVRPGHPVQRRRCSHPP